MHTPPQKKAYVETYGCQMNISDGELMQGILAAQGYALAERPEDADVILVNTCAIREHAEQRVLGRVGELNRIKRERPDVVLGVTGCMAQRMGEALLERAPYVDLVMGPDGYRGLPEVLAGLRPDGTDAATPHDGDAATARHGDAARDGGTERVKRTALPVLGAVPANDAAATKAPCPDNAPADAASVAASPRRPVAASVSSAASARAAVLDFAPHENYEGLEVRRSAGVSAWVPVQRGCDHRCTYCIVPYVRGPEKNRDPQRVLAEVRDVVAAGTPEVTLLGQTVNSYRHGDWDFPRLLRAVARVEGLRRVRFTSPHPGDVTPALVEVMAGEPTVCKQLHLPLQAGSDRTLKRMLRRYTVGTFVEKVEMVRAAMPEIALSTDIIVAFPGETEAEYEATLDVLRRVRFDDAYLYKYSARDGTPATRLPAGDFLPEDVAQARLERIIDLQRGIQAEINRTEVGRVEEVLVEREARSEADVLGRTDRNKVVAFPGDPSLIGAFVHVRLDETTGATFRGTRIDSPAGAARVA